MPNPDEYGAQQTKPPAAPAFGYLFMLGRVGALLDLRHGGLHWGRCTLELESLCLYGIRWDMEPMGMV